MSDFNEKDKVPQVEEPSSDTEQTDDSGEDRNRQSRRDALVRFAWGSAVSALTASTVLGASGAVGCDKYKDSYSRYSYSRVYTNYYVTYTNYYY